MSMNDYVAGGRPLNGRKVLLMLVGFFGCIFVANAALVHYAISTFRGEVADHPYEAGLAFNQEIAAAQAQEALHWTVSGVLSRAESNREQIEIEAHDAKGKAVTGLQFVATLVAPADKANDRILELFEIAPGVYRGQVAVVNGAWDLLIEAKRGGGRIYRSKNRISVE